MFIADSLNPQECRAISISANEEMLSSATNTRILANLNISDCVKEMDPLFKTKLSLYNLLK